MTSQAERKVLVAVTQPEPRLRVVWRMLPWVIAGATCVAIIHISAIANGYYQIYYGRFGWQLPEVAFLLHYLLFGSIATFSLAFAYSLAAGKGLTVAFDRLEGLSTRATRLLVGGSAAITLVVITLVRYGLLQRTAVTDDENAYLFMARILASGRLYLQSMPAEIRPFFDNQFTINDGKWYGIYFPGHPAILALGALAGFVEWIPSILAAATVVLGILVSRRMFGAQTSAVTALLCPITVYLVGPSATLLAHSTAALALIAFVYAAIRIDTSPDAIRWWVIAAVSLSWAGMTRPLGPEAFAVPWLIWVFSRIRTIGTRGRMGARVFCGIVIASMGVFAAYNYTLTGDPFQTGYQRLAAGNPGMLLAGKLSAPWPLPTIYEIGHTILRVNVWQFGWPVSLVFFPFFRRTRLAVVLFWSACAVPLAYALLGMTNVYALGPTHYSEIAVFVTILSAGGFVEMVGRVRQWTSGDRWSRFVMAVPLASITCMLLVFLPIEGVSLREMSELSRAPYTLAEEKGLDRAIVLVRSLPGLSTAPGSWVYYHRHPRPDLQDPVLFLRDLGPGSSGELKRFFPDRKVYVMGMEQGRLVVVPVAP